jgi:hypothetical protein
LVFVIFVTFEIFVGVPRKQLWIGTLEVRKLSGGNEILREMTGAFVTLVTWATDAAEYRRYADGVIGELGGLFVSDVLNAEPVEVRRARLDDGFDEDIEDMISRAEANPNAIIYGTFHMFEKDDA